MTPTPQWKMVPVEPNDAMRKVLVDVYLTPATWARLLAAAPPAPTDTERGGEAVAQLEDALTALVDIRKIAELHEGAIRECLFSVNRTAPLASEWDDAIQTAAKWLEMRLRTGSLSEFEAGWNNCIDTGAQGIRALQPPAALSRPTP